MMECRTPIIYTFKTRSKDAQSPDKFSGTKRLISHWGNAAGVSSADLDYLWETIILEKGILTDVQRTDFFDDIKNLQLTVESLKATIDELVVSNKFCTMKLVEQENAYKSLLNELKSNERTQCDCSNSDTSDIFSEAKTSKRKKSRKRKRTASRSFTDASQLILDGTECEQDNLNLLEAVKNYTTQDCEKLAKMLRNIDFSKGINSDLELGVDLKESLASIVNSAKNINCYKMRKYFPVKTTAQLDKIHDLLNDTEFSDSFDRYLVQIKPTTVKEIDKKMRLLMEDDVAVKFTFFGLRVKYKDAFEKHWLNERLWAAWDGNFSAEEYKKGATSYFHKVSDRLQKRQLVKK